MSVGTAPVFEVSFTNVHMLLLSNAGNPVATLPPGVGGEEETMPAPTRIRIPLPTPPGMIPYCYKCAVVKKSGSYSCCARGGAWYNKCGDVGDLNFEYTWLEGILSCSSKIMACAHDFIW